MRRNRPPGPDPLPLVGNVLEVWRNPLQAMVRLHRSFGDHVYLQLGPYPLHVINDPSSIKRILVDNNRNYVKSRNYQGLRLVLGNGLVTSEGEFWRRQRKLAQPAFVQRRIDAFGPVIVQLTDRLLARWRELPDGTPVDLQAEMTGLTLAIVGRTLFDMDLGADERREVAAEVDFLNHFADEYVDRVVRLPIWVPLPSHLRFRRAKRVVDAMVSGIIADRRRTGLQKDDFLGMLMGATDGQERMDESQLRDEILTLAIAGHETTAASLAWTCYLLATHPEVDRALEEELDRVLGDEPPSVEKLQQLELSDRIVRESMRLYPAAWIFERTALGSDTLGDYTLHAKDTIAISPFTLHRHPGHWPDPERFDPDRFLPAVARARERFAYLPFGAGPRQCIGMGMALLEVKMVLAHIRQHYRLSLVDSSPVEIDAAVTIRPKGGLPVVLNRRQRPRRSFAGAAAPDA